MFQNLYLMTMGGSQTNLQIRQQAGLINNLQTQQMNLMYSMLTQRPAFDHGGVVNPHYFPQNPNCFYPNLSIPVNAPYSMPYSTPPAQFQVPPFINASIPPPNLCFPPTNVRQVPAGSHLHNQIPPPTQQINQAYNTYGSNPGVYQPANLLTRHGDLPAPPVPVNHDTEQNPTYKNSLTQEQVCHIPKDAGHRQPNKEPSSETDACGNVISEKNPRNHPHQQPPLKDVSSPAPRMDSKSVENHTTNLLTHMNEGEGNCNTPKVRVPTGNVVRLEIDANKDKTISPSKKELNSKDSHQSFLCILGLQTEPPESILRENTLFQSVRL